MSIAAQDTLLTEHWVRFPDAARQLRTSRAALSELVLRGRIRHRRVGEELFVRLEDVERVRALRPRSNTSAPPPKPALSYALDRILRLLHDWGGLGTAPDLVTAVRGDRRPVYRQLANLCEMGHLERRGSTWHLTESGWAYAMETEPPV